MGPPAAPGRMESLALGYPLRSGFASHRRGCPTGGFRPGAGFATPPVARPAGRGTAAPGGTGSSPRLQSPRAQGPLTPWRDRFPPRDHRTTDPGMRSWDPRTETEHRRSWVGARGCAFLSMGNRLDRAKDGESNGEEAGHRGVPGEGRTHRPLPGAATTVAASVGHVRDLRPVSSGWMWRGASSRSTSSGRRAGVVQDLRKRAGRPTR